MLMYPANFQKWLDFCQGLLIFLVLVPFDLFKLIKLELFGYFLKNAWGKYPEIWHGDVSWTSSELTKFRSDFVDFPRFGAIST